MDQIPVEQLAPRASLTAAIPTVVYLAVDCRRSDGRATVGGGGDAGSVGDAGASVAGFVNRYTGFVTVYVTMFVFAVVTHPLLRETDYFYPEVIWGASALTVVVGLGELVADREG